MVYFYTLVAVAVLVLLRRRRTELKVDFKKMILDLKL